MTAVPVVDWDEVERRARRLDVLSLLPLTGWFASLVALTGGFFLRHGAGASWAVAGFLLSLAAGMLLQRAVPRLRRAAVVGHRAQFALLHHVDPGPAARETTDVLARRQAGMGRLTWFAPLPLAGLLLNAQWDRPAIAVPAAAVFLGLSGAGVLMLRRQVRRARRWVADPPGPARDVPPPTAVDRWTGGRRLVLVGLVLGLVVGLAAVLIGLLG